MKHLNHVPFVVLMYDILKSGKNDSEHFLNLESVLDIAKTYGLLLKKKKKMCFYDI